MSKYFTSITLLFFFQILLFPKYLSIDIKNLNNILLQEHNKYRYIHNVKKLTLDNKIINAATVYAESLASNSIPYYLEPSGIYYNENEKYGENLFQCNKKSCKMDNISLVTTIWYNESLNYDFSLNEGNKETNNFTQMVWKDTKKMGCGIGVRNDESYKIVCFYYPRGNVDEKYNENVFIGNNTIKETNTEKVIEYNNYDDYINGYGDCFIKKNFFIKVILFILMLLL